MTLYALLMVPPNFMGVGGRGVLGVVYLKQALSSYFVLALAITLLEIAFIKWLKLKSPGSTHKMFAQVILANGLSFIFWLFFMLEVPHGGHFVRYLSNDGIKGIFVLIALQVVISILIKASIWQGKILNTPKQWGVFLVLNIPLLLCLILIPWQQLYYYNSSNHIYYYMRQQMQQIGQEISYSFERTKEYPFSAPKVLELLDNLKYEQRLSILQSEDKCSSYTFGERMLKSFNQKKDSPNIQSQSTPPKPCSIVYIPIAHKENQIIGFQLYGYGGHTNHYLKDGKQFLTLSNEDIYN